MMPVFIRPMWLYAIIPLVLVMLWIYYRKNKPQGLSKICDASLLSELTVKAGNSSLVPFILLGLSWLLTIIVLAGPSWTKVPSPVFKSSATTIILLDLSNEMLVRDTNPSRLARGKYKINDLLKHNSDRQYGLAVFSGESFTVSPVTSDAATIISLLGVLDNGLLPIGGRNLSAALLHAQKLLIQSGQPRGNILLITTGSADASAIKFAQQLSAKGISTSVLGIGTIAGGPIPMKQGFLKDGNDQVILSKLESQSLAKLANAGGGTYKTLTSDDTDLTNMLDEWQIASERAKEDLSFERLHDDGYWLLWILVPLLSLVFRRGWREAII